MDSREQLRAINQRQPWAGPAYTFACAVYFSMFTTFALVFVTMFKLSNAEWPQQGLNIIILSAIFDVAAFKLRSKFTKNDLWLNNAIGDGMLFGKQLDRLIWITVIGINVAIVLYFLIAQFISSTNAATNSSFLQVVLFSQSASLIALTAISPVHTLIYSKSPAGIAGYDFFQVTLLAQKKIRAIGWLLIAGVTVSLVFGQVRLLSTSEKFPILGYILIQIYLSFAILLLASAPFFWRLHDTVIEIKRLQKSR